MTQVKLVLQNKLRLYDYGGFCLLREFSRLVFICYFIVALPQPSALGWGLRDLKMVLSSSITVNE